MDKITTLYSVPPNQETINHLELLLAKAKSGELQTLAATGLLINNGVISCISNPVQPFLLLGAVENLKLSINKHIQ